MTSANRFEDVAMQHIDAVYRTAYALSGCKDTAEDLTQTAFLKAMEHFGSFKMNTNCKAWLLRILRNTWTDQLRRMKTAGPRMPLDEDCLSDTASGEATAWSNAEDLLENFSDANIIEALGQLPEEQRLALYLADVEGLSHGEIAQIAGVAVGTVKSRTSRARAAMKICLAAHAANMGWTGERR